MESQPQNLEFRIESQPQKPEFRNNPENFHPCICIKMSFQLPCIARTLV